MVYPHKKLLNTRIPPLPQVPKRFQEKNFILPPKHLIVLKKVRIEQLFIKKYPISLDNAFLRLYLCTVIRKTTQHKHDAARSVPT